MKDNWAKEYIHSAVVWINDRAITHSLCKASQALVELCEKLKKEKLNTVLGKDSTGLDGWSLADALWIAIYRKHPRLWFYPLGEITERAVKKTVVSLISEVVNAESNGNLQKLSIDKFRNKFSSYERDRLLKCFLTHYFFEICIDYMRRPGVWSRGYNFPREHQMVSPEAERKLRENLKKQCKESAECFLTYLERALDNSKDAVKQIRTGFEKVFGGALSVEGKRQKLNDNYVNVIVGIRSAADIRKSYTLDTRAKRFLLHAKHPNVSASYDSLKDSLKCSPHSLVKDLFDLGVAVYMSDLYVGRSHNLARRIGIYMPMRHHDRWLKAKEKVKNTIAILGRDDVRTHFVKYGKPMKEREFSIEDDDRCVCLFSGGLDSLAGVVWAFDNGLTPILISHYASNKLGHMQRSLVEKLKGKYEKEIQHLCFKVGKSRSRKARYRLSSPLSSVMAQHLRSFLFLSLACAVALEKGIGKVYIFENGPVALNPLFSEARVNTRTAHPHFLASFQEMVNSVFGVELRIENPFLYMTKGEVASILARSKLKQLVKETNSCWNWFRVPLIANNRGIRWRGETHDGDCIPCIIRRAAIYRAGLCGNDAEYLTDVFSVFSNPGRSDDNFTALADFLRFCANVKSLSGTALLLHAPDLSIYEEGIDSEELVRMYKEHAKEVINCFNAKSSKSLREAFAHVLV